ncbi:MAG TPA: ferredoxin [Acidimicrobiales bacterium]|nr:ferredoxin [Acidimicrobiales bacterium]
MWIDQDLCTGDGICAEIAPKIFEMDDDGLAYVKEKAWPNRFGPSGSGSSPALKMTAGADMPDDLADAVIEAAEECPGECIFFDPE